jgi:hypothetical protein
MKQGLGGMLITVGLLVGLVFGLAGIILPGAERLSPQVVLLGRATASF